LLLAGRVPDLEEFRGFVSQASAERIPAHDTNRAESYARRRAAVVRRRQEEVFRNAVARRRGYDSVGALDLGKYPNELIVAQRAARFESYLPRLQERFKPTELFAVLQGLISITYHA
jgi:hypothetical protein